MSFKPLWGFNNPVWQTILGAKLPCFSKKPQQHYHLRLADGDILALAISTPKQWTETKPTVIALHGLGGSHQARYMLRLQTKVLRLGYRFVAVNFRGCGVGEGLAKGLYNAGSSADVLEVIAHLKAQNPHSKLILVGYSLGGNIALKLAGELQHQAKENLAGLIAITPPVDLISCADLMKMPQNTFFRRYYIRKLWQKVLKRHARFPELGAAPAANMDYGFWEFDEHYTAPQTGFSSALDYYKRCSSLPILGQIQIPCRLLFAKDDPFIDCGVIEQVCLPSKMEVLITPGGGHMGFLAAPNANVPLRWMDHKITEWIEELLVEDELG